MSVINLDLEQLGKLVIDGFNDLANAVQKNALFSGHLHFLIAAWQRHQLDTVVCEEMSGFFGADVSLVSQNVQVGMFAQHFKTYFQIIDVGWRQFKIEDQAVLLGRGSDQAPLTDQTVSRRHAELKLEKGAWILRDLNSANGTYLNGERAGETELAPGWTDFHKRILVQAYDVTGLLRDGRKVLVHCRGGLGRAGIVAARLRVEAGEAPARRYRVLKARPARG